MPSIRIASRIRKWNHLCQFRWKSTKIIPIEKTHTHTEDLDEERKIKRFKKYKTIKHSSKFQAIVFQSHKKMRDSTQLCTGEDCQQHNGSCKMFQKNDLKCLATKNYLPCIKFVKFWKSGIIRWRWGWWW